MIIECPACNTRYDIKVELPPEGRTVRCAKCEHVWRAMPPEEEEEDYSAGAGEASGADAGDEAPAFFRKGAESREAPQPFDEDPSLGSGPASGEEGFEEDGAAGRTRSGAKPGWFGSFLRKSQKPVPSPEAQQEEPSYEEPENEGPGLEREPAPAGPLPFHRPAIAPEALAQAEAGVRGLDDARAAVRSVFASIGDRHQNAAAIQAPVTAYAGAARSEIFPNARAPETSETGGAGWESEAKEEFAFAQEQRAEAPAVSGGWGAEENGESAAGESAPRSWLHDWQAQAEKSESPSQSVLDAQLRAALQAHFPSHKGPPDRSALESEEQFQQQEEDEAGGEETAVSEALTAFWKRPATVRSEPESEAPAPLDSDEDPAAGDISFDEQLFHEIEETQEHASRGSHGHRDGGLALAAAWGLFICVAGGLTAGLFAFRDIAAGAVPGLASFYQAVGMPVTAQPLIFEGVQYEWTISEIKPVLHIKGAVYNRAQHSVKTPQFTVSIKDNDPALDKDFPASLPIEGDKIAPEQRTEFDIELVSPSPTITAVELELRDVR